MKDLSGFPVLLTAFSFEVDYGGKAMDIDSPFIILRNRHLPRNQ